MMVFVKEIKDSQNRGIEDIGRLLDKHCKSYQLATLNWKEFPYLPGVSFKIAHNNHQMLLKYTVSEKYIKAIETKTNGDVYKDTCVEFFISFDHENYYNLEFNGIGTRHMGYGTGRHGRELLDPKVVEAIQVKSSLGTKPFDEKKGQFKWEATMVIPVGCFINNNIESLKGVEATVNFYKCGDETSAPHYVTYFPVGTPSPDYHQPGFFGKLLFE